MVNDTDRQRILNQIDEAKAHLRVLESEEADARRAGLVDVANNIRKDIDRARQDISRIESVYRK